MRREHQIKMDVAEECRQRYPTIQEVLEELKRMTNIGFPIATMSFVGYLRNMIQVMCMGRLGSLELAGGSLAIGLTNIIGYSVLSGLAMGMESLCGQAFGSRNLSMAHHTLRRTIIMLLLASIPIGLLFHNLEQTMLCVGQNPEITLVASLYCKFSVPDLVAVSILHPLRIYLRSKGTTWPLMWCTLFSTLLHLPITVYLAFTLSLGIRGIAISSSIANFINVFFLLCYIFFTRVNQCAEETMHVPLLSMSSQQSLTNSSRRGEWMKLLRLAIPSCLGVCLEWWWYECMTILTGYLSEPRVALAASGIVIQTTSLMYTLPSALSASVSTRVGNELGSGRPWKARLATMVSIGIALVISLFGLLFTTLGRDAWGKLFTNDNEVLKLTMSILPIIGLCELANCPQTTSCGILRGSARPTIGAGINFYSFYLVGAPMAIILGFYYELGFLGFCYGLLAAQVACVVSILVVVYKTDWEKESMKAKHLVGIDYVKPNFEGGEIRVPLISYC